MPALSPGWWKGWRGPKPLTADFGDRGRGFNALSVLHCAAEQHLLRETMNALEARLDPARFIRIHRATLVNVDRVKELHPLFHGDWEVVLRNGVRLTLTRTHRDRAQRLLAAAPEGGHCYAVWGRGHSESLTRRLLGR